MTQEQDLVPDDPTVNELPDPPGPGAWQWDADKQQWIPAE